jgi:hypothetical protein
MRACMDHQGYAHLPPHIYETRYSVFLDKGQAGWSDIYEAEAEPWDRARRRPSSEVEA